MDDFSDYDKHFTVMNYREESQLKQVNCEEFVPLFNQQYPDHNWSDVQVRREGGREEGEGGEDR